MLFANETRGIFPSRSPKSGRGKLILATGSNYSARQAFTLSRSMSAPAPLLITSPRDITT